MSLRRKLCNSLAAAATILALTASPSMAIVGGNNASPGEYTSVARINFGLFQCTGTLISADTVLSAGHCGSLTGAAVASPAAYPPQAITVRIGGYRYAEGEQVPVKNVTVSPDYLLTDGYDISVLKLSRNSTNASTSVAGGGERSIWSAGTLATIAGWGVTEEGGDTPAILQEAQVPITTDAYCGNAYDNFDATTMVCAGYPQGGVDTCQGDSGGPMFGRNAAGALRVVGATSFGEGCARPGKPGVYARVGDAPLRTWISSQDSDGVGP